MIFLPQSCQLPRVPGPESGVPRGLPPCSKLAEVLGALYGLGRALGHPVINGLGQITVCLLGHGFPRLVPNRFRAVLRTVNR
jgi:hypothetical protein